MHKAEGTERGEGEWKPWLFLLCSIYLLMMKILTQGKTFNSMLWASIPACSQGCAPWKQYNPCHSHSRHFSSIYSSKIQLWQGRTNPDIFSFFPIASFNSDSEFRPSSLQDAECKDALPLRVYGEGGAVMFCGQSPSWSVLSHSYHWPMPAARQAIPSHAWTWDLSWRRKERTLSPLHVQFRAALFLLCCYKEVVRSEQPAFLISKCEGMHLGSLKWLWIEKPSGDDQILSQYHSGNASCNAVPLPAPKEPWDGPLTKVL